MRSKSIFSGHFKVAFILMGLMLFLFPVRAFAASERESNNVPGSATRINLNETVKGSIDDTDDEDWYKFSITKNGHFNFVLKPDPSADDESIGCGWSITLKDSDRNDICEFKTEKRNKSDELGLVPGTYYIKVKPFLGNSGAINCMYNLKVSFTSDANWSTDKTYRVEKYKDAKAISSGRTYTGTIYNEDDLDYYRLKLSGKGKIRLRFTIDPSVNDDDIHCGWKVAVYNKNFEEVYCETFDKSDTTELIPYNGSVYVMVKSYLDNWGAISCIYHIKVKNYPAPEKLAQTRILKAKNLKGKKAFVTWKKNRKAGGYQIQFSRRAGFARKYTKSKTLRGNSRTKYTRKLPKGKWYVRVRCYKGKKCSSWSRVRIIKIKK